MKPSFAEPFDEHTTVGDIIAHARAKLRFWADAYYKDKAQRAAELRRAAELPAVVVAWAWNDPPPVEGMGPWLRFSATVEFYPEAAELRAHAERADRGAGVHPPSITLPPAPCVAAVSFDGTGDGAMRFAGFPS